MQSLIFPQGPAGRTGEEYFTVGIQRGQRVEVIRDTQQNFLVFKDRRIAEKIVSDFERLQREEPNYFTDTVEKARFHVIRVSVGIGGQVVIPSLGSITTR